MPSPGSLSPLGIFTACLRSPKGSPINQQEQDKLHAARAAFIQTPKRKRKHSTAKDHEPNSATAPPETPGDRMPSPKRFKFPGMTSTKPSDSPTKVPLIVRFYDAEIQAKDAHGRTQEDMLTWSWNKLESCHNYIQMLFPVPEGSAFNWEAPIIDREVMDTFRSRHDLQDRLRLSFEKMLDFYGFQITTQSDAVGKTKEEAEVHDNSEDPTSSTAGGSTSAATKSEGDAKKDEVVETKDDITEGSLKITVLSSETSSAHSGYDIARAPHWRISFRNWAVRFDHNHLRITRILRCLRILGLQTECEAFFKVLKDVFDDPSFNISERTMSYWTRAVNRPLYIAPDDEQVEWLKKWEEQQEQEQEKAGKAGNEVLAKEE
ncbi:opioid growth factor receptor conserved region-domain-containing protein [Phaeosphaeria sp. MPI-PUGE-AT-0046c]|nr:opioid growth factor receptor conserved region-domain-containing protein [Phaeosphaeria sp. MPI-PUGE-AT-0046c]